jgi:hypothetical protein
LLIFSLVVRAVDTAVGAADIAESVVAGMPVLTVTLAVGIVPALAATRPKNTYSKDMG